MEWMNSEIEITAFIPYTEIARIKEGMPASIEMEGYTTGTDSHLNGKVKTVYKEVLKKEGNSLMGNLFPASPFK